MVVCRCRKATRVYCFVHQVPVCGECICFPEHQLCVVKNYAEWVVNSEYDWPQHCSFCNSVLEAGSEETTRLGCLHVMHTKCLISHVQSFPTQTAPAGFVCPSCSIPIWPPLSIKDTGSRLHAKLKEVVAKTGLEKNVFGNHFVTVPKADASTPPAFASDPLKRLSGSGESNGASTVNSSKDATLSSVVLSKEDKRPAGMYSSGTPSHVEPEIVEIDGPSPITTQLLEHEPNFIRSPSFNDVLEGEIFLQNLPSIVAARVLDPQPGERILDMCAAPGGKTTAIAILMRDEGEIVALDRSHNKVMGILKLADEMGLSCIKAYKLDALKSVRETNEARNLGVADTCSEAIVTMEENSVPCYITTGANVTNAGEDSSTTIVMHNDDPKPDARRYVSKADLRKNLRRMRNGTGRSNCSGGRVEDSKGFFPSSFDRVLLDAPCSALGLRPRLFAGEETLESLRKNATYQRRMFDQAVKLVRPGGVIVYSTCTINPGENEGLVRYALDTYKFLSLGSQHPKVGGSGIIGSCKLPNKGYTEEWLTEHEAQLVQRFDPSSSLDTMGFFIAKFNVGSKEG